MAMNTHGQQIEIGERLDQQSRCFATVWMEIETSRTTGLQLMRLAMKADQEFLVPTPTVKKTFCF